MISPKDGTAIHMDMISHLETLPCQMYQSRLISRSHLTTDLETRLIHWDRCTVLFLKSQRLTSSRLLIMTKTSWDSLLDLTLEYQRTSIDDSSSHSTSLMTLSLSMSLHRRTQVLSQVNSSNAESTRMLTRVERLLPQQTCQLVATWRSTDTPSTSCHVMSSLRSTWTLISNEEPPLQWWWILITEKEGLLSKNNEGQNILLEPSSIRVLTTRPKESGQRLLVDSKERSKMMIECY